jgi:hypothetical protein
MRLIVEMVSQLDFIARTTSRFVSWPSDALPAAT